MKRIIFAMSINRGTKLELYGLVSIIDDHVFGDLKSFKVNYACVSRAIASTLDSLSYKLKKLIEEAEKQKAPEETGIAGIEQNFENYDELSDEWTDNEEDSGENEDKKFIYTREDIELMKKERMDIERFCGMAKKIWENSKGEALLVALKKGFEMTAELNARKKAIIFTEPTSVFMNFWTRSLTCLRACSVRAMKYLEASDPALILKNALPRFISLAGQKRI